MYLTRVIFRRTTMKQEIKYIQVEFNGLKPGTLVVRAEPTTAHLQARAMVGVPVPGMYYQALGDDEVHWVPSFKGILDNHHPLDPRKSAPAYITEVQFGEDILPGIKGVKWSVDRSNWPECKLMVCIDPQRTVDERYSALYFAAKEIEGSPDVIVAKKLLHDQFNKVLDPMEEEVKDFWGY